MVFFVDDDPMILNLLEYTFKSRSGIDVRTFLSGEECLKSLHEKPDVIVLDHMFPQKGAEDGLNLLEKIRKHNNNISVIVLSSQQDQSLIPKFIEKGASRYIAKDDYFIDSLIEAIEKEVHP